MSNATPAAGSTALTPGWEEDIRGMLSPFAAQMMWRLDLGSYENVKANVDIIAGRIIGPGADMPPDPFPRLTAEDQAAFVAWQNAGCPQTRPTTAA